METDCIEIHIAPPTKTGWSNESKETLFYHTLPAHLKSLDLSFTGLGSFPTHSFQKFTQLIFLSLEFNSITALHDPLTFQGLDQLRVLWLTGNHIQPNENIYSTAVLLQNNIQFIHDQLFEPLHSIQVLLMHHNQLQSLDTTMFTYEKRPHLRVLKVLDNDWNAPTLASFRTLQRIWSSTQSPRQACARNVPSRGECIQLDVAEDSGDDLEDIWDENEIALAKAKIFHENMERIQKDLLRPGRGSRRDRSRGNEDEEEDDDEDFSMFEDEDNEEEEEEEEEDRYEM